jgi:preprotein translocase subunit SecA
MDNLRQEISMVGIGQKDPLQEYKKFAFGYFEELIKNIRVEICSGLFRTANNFQVFENMLSTLSRKVSNIGPANEEGTEEQSYKKYKNKKDIELPKIVIHQPKIGRNSPCSCGSGKKYKKCCGNEA